MSRRRATGRREDHPRNHADLRHPRVRDSAMLVAAKVDAEHRTDPPQVINEHPGVFRTNYLRNPRVKPLVHDRRRGELAARAEGNADVSQALTGAESIRQLQTL